MHAAAVVAGRHLGEAAPAAADFEDGVAGPGVETVEQAQVLGALRRFERGLVAVAEERGRVAHGRVEPEAVEVVAEVVVGEDVATRTAARVGTQQVAQAVAQQRPPLAAHGDVEFAAVLGEQGQQVGEAVAVPLAVDIALAEADVAFGQGPLEHALVMHDELGTFGPVAQVQAVAAGQGQA